MEIIKTEDNNLIIKGEMKTIEDYTSIKTALTEMLSTGTELLTIEIKDSMTITSSIIGLFTKTVHGDGMKISLAVHNDRLYNLLEDLNLIGIFKVRKAEGS